jgi:hypothetical protein
VYLVDTKLSAQDVLTSRHNKLPPIQKKSRVTCVKVLDMVSRGWLFAGLHMRPNAQHGYVKMVPDSTLDVAPHGSRTSKQNKTKM